MGIGNSNPQELLDVSGAIKIGGTLVGAADAGSIRWNGTNFQGYNGTTWVNLDGGSSGDSDWTISGSDQYSAVAGNVGIGTTTPDYRLDVEGDLGVNNSIFHNGDPNTYLSFTPDRIQLFAGSGSSSWIDMQQSATEMAINENGVNRDLRVEGGTDIDLLFVDGSADMIGISTNSPSATLDVEGSFQLVNGTEGAGKVLSSDATGLSSWVDPVTLPTANDGDWTISGVDQYSAVTGNVGIGTTGPDAKLEVYTSGASSEMYLTKDGSQSSSFLFRNGTSGTQGTSFGLTSAEHFMVQNNISDKDFIFSVNDGGSPTNLLALDASEGRVGIGTTTPEYLLDVDGDMGVNNRVAHNGDANTYMSFTTDRIQLFAGSGSSSWIDMQNSVTEMAINENGVNRDLRVEGGNDVNLLFIDGSADMIGVSTNSPSATLDVEGTFQLVDGTEGASKVLTSDASGNASWQAATVDTDTQNTLDEAYDEGGAGAGRVIVASDGALRVNGDDGFIVTGTVGGGDLIEVSGAGTRMFFNPNKAAFRAGSVQGTQWDPANIGTYSIGLGLNSLASGHNSTAIGYLSQATGDDAMVFGYNSIASGQASHAMGFGVESESAFETVVGLYDTDYVPANAIAYNAADRLFVVGNGTTPGNRSNALTIYKNGTMNINDAYDMPTTDGTADYVMKTDGAGVVTWVDPNTITTNTQNTLDEAYDEGGAGAGRTINATSGAVHVTGSGGLHVDANVGLGTTSPNAALHLEGISPATYIDAYGNLGGNVPALFLRRGRGSAASPSAVQSGDNLGWLRFGGYNGSSIWGYASILARATESWTASAMGTAYDFRTVANGTTTSSTAMSIDQNARVGIGTTSPIAPLHVENSNNATYGNFTFYALNQYTNTPNNPTSCCGGTVNNVAIHANGRVMASEFDAFSDARIKLVEGLSNSSQDLNTLMDIEITDYRMKDAAKNDKEYKKVIAQQVESVYPQAVSTITDVVPDIYEVGKMKNGFIALSVDVVVGDNVRLIFEDETLIAPVTEVNKEGFRVELDRTENVFVYGREVDDFRTVDYEAISMLNVSATQELVKRINRLEEENALLKTDFSSLRAEIDRLKDWTKFEEGANK